MFRPVLDILQYVHKYTPHTSDIHLAFFLDDNLYNNCLQTGYVIRKMQCGLTSLYSWCKIRLRLSVCVTDIVGQSRTLH